MCRSLNCVASLSVTLVLAPALIFPRGVRRRTDATIYSNYLAAGGQTAGAGSRELESGSRFETGEREREVDRELPPIASRGFKVRVTV